MSAAMGFAALGLVFAAVLRSRRHQQQQQQQQHAGTSPVPPAASRTVDTILTHNTLLPAEMVQRIPELEKRVLLFLLRLVHSEKLPIPSVLVNGGYVRDLLLGQVPDDLDVSLCLRECAADVTVESILDLLDKFAQEHPELGVANVKTTTIISDETKNKQIDTAKAVVCMHDGRTVELDLMPTIGKETYDDHHNRIPTRDHRGTPEEDALRRDLTIGALFLAVSEPTPPCATTSVDDATAMLQWRLLDYYGGIDDVLHVRQLRAPFPTDEPVFVLIDEVLDTEMDVKVWNQGAMPGYLKEHCGEGLEVDVRWLTDEQCVDARVSNNSTGVGMLDVRQPVWWIKVLKDDPLRIVRTLRFAAKLDFSIHDSFWVALPFALPSLKSKVAGSRKVEELIKLAKMGKRKLQTLFLLSLAHTFAVHDRDHNGDLKQDRLAVYLFGGNDGDGVAHYMRPVLDFDEARFLAILSKVPSDTAELSRSLAGTVVSPHDSLLGSMLAIALDCASFGSPAGASDAGDESSAARDRTTQGLELHQFDLACSGLCASNHARAAGVAYLNALAGLTEDDTAVNSTPPVAVRDMIQRRMPSGLPGFELLCKVWVALSMAKSPEHYVHDVVLAALAYDCADGAVVSAVELERCIKVLRRPGPSVRGGCFQGLSKAQMPVHMRAGMITLLNVFGRCEKFEWELHTTSQLRAYLSGETRGCAAVADECRGSLFDELTAEWTDPDTGELKQCYEQSKVKSKRKKKSGK